MNLEEKVNTWIERIEIDSKGLFICPKENKKNIHVKACWLLSKYQRMRIALLTKYNASDPEVVHCDKQITTLKDFLPIAQEYVKNP